jgi:hypothetical protein
MRSQVRFQLITDYGSAGKLASDYRTLAAAQRVGNARAQDGHHSVILEMHITKVANITPFGMRPKAWMR